MDDTDDAPTCPACGGPGVLLGTLGRLEHFRCRDCGAEFSRRPDQDGTPDDPDIVQEI